MYDHFGHAESPETPVGLTSINGALRKIYPEQDNPLIVSTVVKYW